MFRFLIVLVCLYVSYSESSPVPQVVVAHHGFPYFYHTGVIPLVHDASKMMAKTMEDAAKMAAPEMKMAKSEAEENETKPEEPSAPAEEQSDDGSYKDDTSGDYAPDNSGDYVHDNSGEYKPELELKLAPAAIVYAGNPFIPAPVYPFPYYI